MMKLTCKMAIRTVIWHFGRRPDNFVIFVDDEENSQDTKEMPSGKNEESGESDVKVKITVGDTELTASMEDNVTTRAILEQMPMTLPMMDLYGREMCYRYGASALPTDHLQSDGYEVGDIVYWAPVPRQPPAGFRKGT